MLIKNSNTKKSSLSPFDLLGDNETALAKAFSYLLATNKECYFEFINFLGVRISNTEKNYTETEIQTERHRDEGRTDIELSDNRSYQVIVECKVNSGKVVAQRTQYLTAFNPSIKAKVLCFLTQERDTNKQYQNDILIKNTSWLEIIELFNNKKYFADESVTTFLKFATKNYKMRELKEILIQDLKDPVEIERFTDFAVYRRDQTFGTPIYFAPYFTRGATLREGICNISRILGILTLKPVEIQAFRTDLEGFSDDITQVERWISGVLHGNDNPNIILTYYFLDRPFEFTTPLLKDRGNHKGVGEGWISKFIPKNRCVSFIDFIKHIPELNRI